MSISSSVGTIAQTLRPLWRRGSANSPHGSLVLKRVSSKRGVHRNQVTTGTGTSFDDMPESLKRQILFGLEALRDPQMERRVHEHLAALGESPRNVFHAAMIASRFRREATGAASNRAASEPTSNARLHETTDTVALRDALGTGSKAMDDPTVEAAVEAYFAKNPGCSRDPIHVAAVACHFASRQQQTAPGSSPGLRA